MPTTTRRVRKKPVKNRRLQIADPDAVLLRCATIERRLDGIDTMLNILTHRISSMQAQLDHVASKIRF